MPRRDYPLPEVCGGRGRTVRRDEVKRFWYGDKRKEVVREVPEENAPIQHRIDISHRHILMP